MTLSVSYVKLTTKNSKGAQYLLNAGDLAYMLLEEFRCWLGLRHQHAERGSPILVDTMLSSTGHLMIGLLKGHRALITE